MPVNHHWCVGVDLHKDTLTACVFCGCCGEYSFQKIPCKCRKQVAAYFAALPRPHTVAIESVGFYRWLWEMLEPIVEQLVLADATQARALAEIDDFDGFLWSFVNGRTVQNRWREMGEVPDLTDASTRMSKDLRKRGFRFVGPTICYAFMQSAGLVNDHLVRCFRHAALGGTEP